MADKELRRPYRGNNAKIALLLEPTIATVDHPGVDSVVTIASRADE